MAENGLDRLLVKGTVIIVPAGYYKLDKPIYLGDAKLIGTYLGEEWNWIGRWWDKGV